MKIKKINLSLTGFIIIYSTTIFNSVAANDENVISQQEQDYARENLAAANLDAKKLEVKAEELKIRGGMPNFFKKVKAGKPVVIAYFGGSITAHNGWRPQSFKAIQKMFPDSKMTMIPASVGGSGSIVGVFRADKDLIGKNPDLVFIEFAVNDGGDAVRRTKDVIRSLEGIILKLKKNNPETDICFFYTMQTHDVKTVKKGFCQPAAAVHEQVAAYYNLPSIYIGPSVVKEIEDGKAVFKGKVADKTTGKDSEGKLVITEDNTHPVLPTGHQFYADAVMRGIETMSKAVNTSSNKELPKPIYGTTWELAKTIPVDGNALFKGRWEKLTAADGPSGFRFGKRIYDWFPFLYRTSEPGASVTVEFKGTVVGIKGIDGPDSGIVDIEIDGKSTKPHNHFTVYNTHWFYGGGALPEQPDGIHKVKWSLSGDKPDKGKILASYYRKGNDKDFLKNPKKYEPNTFSVGEIVLIGEIIKK